MIISMVTDLCTTRLYLTVPASYTFAGTFQFIYFFSSFWGQFGPNCTTFLLAGVPLLASVLWLLLPANDFKKRPFGVHAPQDAPVQSSSTPLSGCCGVGFWPVIHTLHVVCSGELYPTGCRTTAHGISAGTAKVGALWASVWFNYLPSRTKFWTTSSFNFGGLLLTALFMPDPVCMHGAPTIQ